MRNSVLKKAALVAVVALSPAAALAQNDTTTDTTYPTPVQHEDEDDFPWGLLGLLGLAGLLGLKKRERDIHVDARRDS